MKIDDRHPLADLPAAGVRDGKPAKPADAKPETTVLKPDTVALSSKAQELRKAEKIMPTLPDIRTDKVETIKRRIRNGTYEIDSGKIATKMIEDAILHNT